MCLQVRAYPFFKDTKHLIDVCHESNPTTCTECFKLTHHKLTGHRRFHLMKSTAAEVGNQGFDKLKKSVRYMSLGRFMDTCRLHMEIANRMRMRDMASTHQTEHLDWLRDIDIKHHITSLLTQNTQSAGMRHVARAWPLLHWMDGGCCWCWWWSRWLWLLCACCWFLSQLWL